MTLTDAHFFTVWREDVDAPNVPHDSVTIHVGGSDDGEGRVRRAAELVAAEDAKKSGHDDLWPIDYRVLDATGRLWSVRVDRVTRPTLVAGTALELPALPPAVHVLWNSRAICEDARLLKSPSRWPGGQRWMSLREFAEGVHEGIPEGELCAACRRSAPALVKGRA